MDEILKDKRFAHVAKDPRFRKMPVAERKVKIDNRFKHMFRDKRFKVKYSVDKRGRPVNLTTNENLRKYYELSDGENTDEDENREQRKLKKAVKQDSKKKEKGKKAPIVVKSERGVTCDSDESSSEGSNDYESDKAVSVKESGVDLARGEGNVESSSSSCSEESSDEEGEEDGQGNDSSKFDHHWGEVDDNVEAVEEATRRLAVCNMDWDRIKAKDVYVLLNSFKPATGLVKSVKIFPSEFGKQRLAEEESQGPQELTEVKLEDGAEEEDLAVDKEGTRYHMEKLREYQLKRLQYYYAVVECDSVATADEIYKQCDGMEYESSATKLDLRFIPDRMQFSEDEVTSNCTETPVGYKPQFFTNAALSQSKVDLTWDETDRDRLQVTGQQFSKKTDDIGEADLKAYLASSSDEEEGPDYGALLEEEEESEGGEGNEDRQIDKYKKLLLDIDSEERKKEREIQMEITWEPGLRGTTEDIVKKKKQSKSSTVWDEYLQRKKDKKKQKIEARKKKKQQEIINKEDSNGEGQGDEVAFSDDEIPEGVDMSHPFFSQELTDTHTEAKKDKKKGRKKKKKEIFEPDDVQQKAELSLLVMDEEAEDKKHFNYNDLIQPDGKKKKKGKNSIVHMPEQDFKVDVTDPRFSAMYESHLFNIDPSAPEFKKTKGTEAIIAEKLKRNDTKQKKKRVPERMKEDRDVKKVKLDVKPAEESIANLVKSVKAKTKHFQSNKTQR